MVDKRANVKTWMNLFFGIILVVVLLAFVFAATVAVGGNHVVNKGNYSASIFLNCTSDLNLTTGIYNVSYYYNASEGPVDRSAANLLATVTNQSGDYYDHFNISVDVSTLPDGLTYNISCWADNGTNQEEVSVFNVTIDNTPPAVNFSDVILSVVNYGNYSSAASLAIVNINVSFSDAIWTNYGTSLASVYINVTNSSGGRAPTDNWTRAQNLSALSVFFNTTIDFTDYPNGKYNITIWANDSVLLTNGSSDAVTNLNNTERIQITIDDTAPVSVILTAGTGTTTTQNVITITASENLSEIDSCNVVYDPAVGEKTIAGTGTAVQTLTHTGLSCGRSYDYIVTCSNQAGLSTDSASTRFTASSCGSGSSSTVESVQKVDIFSVDVDEEVTLSNFEEDMGIEKIIITVTEKANNAKLTVRKFNTQPSEITVPKTGNVHKYLQIVSENLVNKMDKAVITIKVQKNWLSDNSIEKANIATFKFNEVTSKWDELLTVYKSEDVTYYYYDVEVDSFSYFAIAEKALTESEEPEPEPEPTNLLWLWITLGVVVVAIIIGGGFAAKKRR